MSDQFVFYEDNKDEFKMWQGLKGPYYTPYVDEDGNLSWTNNGGLPNPATVNIKGVPGTGLEIKGIVESVSALPASAASGSVYLVGTEPPYDGYLFADGGWTYIGVVGVGENGRGIVSITKTGTAGLVDTYTITYTDGVNPTTFTVTNGTPGVGVPTGGTAGQVLAKASGTDYDTEWVNQSAGVDPATATPLMDGTGAVGSSTKYAREDHVHPVYDQLVRPNLLDNWYFVGGGSQQGGGQFPINQRGQTSYSGEEYTIDRWIANGSFTLASDGISIGSDVVLYQAVSNINALVGKQLSFSALTANELITASFVFSIQTINYAVTDDLAIGYSTSLGGFTIYARNSNAIKILAAKLELGSTQTLAHQENGTWVLNEIPNYSEQLYRCCASTAESGDVCANNPYTNVGSVYIGTSEPTNKNIKFWLDTDEPGMSAVSSVNGKTGTVVIDSVPMTLLWTNASPTSAFVAQAISLDLSEYDLVVLNSLFSTSVQYILPSIFCKIGDTAYFTTTDTANTQYGRTAKPQSTGVTFGNGSSGGSQNNIALIPYRIYGIKLS